MADHQQSRMSSAQREAVAQSDDVVIQHAVALGDYFASTGDHLGEATFHRCAQEAYPCFDSDSNSAYQENSDIIHNPFGSL